MLTVVYALVDRNLKSDFWKELRQSRLGKDEAWILCGDFNAIRARHEKFWSPFLC